MISVRLNTLKEPHEDILARIKVYFPEVYIQSLPWSKEACVLEGITRKEVLESPLIAEGYCYLQSLSSMLPTVVLDPKPHEHILDLCAAPGGKTTHMAACMENTGEILANDNSRARLYKLKDVLRRYGVENTTTTAMRGEQLYRRYPDAFDRVLLDAPCSMNQQYARKRLKWLVTLQKKLLRSALSACRPGGVVVYATCTSTQEENEEVVHYVLSRDTRATLEPITFSGVDAAWHTTDGMLRIEPSEQYDAFFIAKLRRTI